ncbi:hypothetical protein [Flavobacterium sp.]|jgi:hypothetical protein|uniref:hypothetical protein n=1 Tax=Flavobacterium sp. TaxID=239 RepID=UPI0037C0CC2D
MKNLKKMTEQNLKLSNFESEFEVIGYLLNSNNESRAIDSFSLSLLKIEKQIRKIFTHLIYQYECFEPSDKIKIINILSANNNIYFRHLISGINLIYIKEIKDIYGFGYEVDYNSISNLKSFRNKIFHGQLTGQELNRTDLTEFVTIMKRWSKQIAESFHDEINYDGFERNSLKKSKKNFTTLLKCKFKL